MITSTNMKFGRPTLVTVTAPTCSGKNYLLDAMTKEPDYRFFKPDYKPKTPWEPLFSRIVSTTTRPRREGETEGFDYHFISVEKSKEMEANGEFAELIEFRGTRYGVTKDEMEGKMHGNLAPIIILEPQGLKIYEQMCIDNGWDIFKIFINTDEVTRLKRLNERTSIDIRNAVLDIVDKSESAIYRAKMNMDALTATEKLMRTHTDRLLSITGEERRWIIANRWDAIVSGVDTPQAIKDIAQGIKWRNYRNGQLNTNR